MNYIQEQKYPCYYPGAYCPPNKMHLNTVHWLLSKPEIGHINIVIGKDNPNEPLTQDQKCKLWEMLLKSKFSAQATVHKAKENGPVSEIYEIFNKKRQESAFIALHEKAGRDKRFQKKFDTFPNYGIQILPSQFEESSRKLLTHIQNKDRAHARHHLPEDFSDEMVDEYMNICNTKPIQADTQANTPLLNYKDYYNKMFGNGFWSNVFQPMAESMLNESSGDSNKEKIEEIFKSIPELSSVGTPEQYSKYLDTIFPDSKVKDIVYHGSPNKIENFISPEMKGYIKQDTTTTGVAGIYFSNKKEVADLYQDFKKEGKKGTTYAAVLNSKRPLIVGDKATDGTNDSTFGASALWNIQKGVLQGLRKAGIDAIKTGEYASKTSAVGENVEIAVFEPKQIHILGNQQDIEGFKKYIARTHKSTNKSMLNESNSISIPEYNKRKKEIEKEKSYIKAFNKLEKENPTATKANIEYYLVMYFIYRKNKAFAELQDITSINFTLKKIEKIVDANFEKTESNVDIKDTNFEGSEDVVYNENNLLILLGDLKEKCIRYGTGKKWCISRRDTSNMFFSYRMRLDEPVFYFVFDKSKLPLDKYRAIVIYIDNKGKYMVADADNQGDKEMTWSEIESIQPKLKGLQDLFKHIPLTQQEREDYEKFKDLVEDSVYEKYNYTEREKYIGFGHDLTEEQIRMTWAVPNQKALVSKYVTTGFGTNLPKDIESKLSPSDRAKNTAARREYIKNILEGGKNLFDKQFESCNDELKKYYIEKMIEESLLPNRQFELCNDELKKYYIEKIIEYEKSLYDEQFELCNDELKKYYIEKNVEKGYLIFNKQFEWCDDELKRKYIEKRIEKRIEKGELVITFEQLEWCDDKLKRKYIEKRIERENSITIQEFKLLNDDFKRYYFKKMIEKRKHIPSQQFELLNYDLKGEYVEKIIKLGVNSPMSTNSEVVTKWAENNGYTIPIYKRKPTMKK